MGTTHADVTIRSTSNGHNAFTGSFLVEMGAIDCVSPVEGTKRSSVPRLGKHVFGTRKRNGSIKGLVIATLLLIGMMRPPITLAKAYELLGPQDFFSHEMRLAINPMMIGGLEAAIRNPALYSFSINLQRDLRNWNPKSMEDFLLGEGPEYEALCFGQSPAYNSIEPGGLRLRFPLGVFMTGNQRVSGLSPVWVIGLAMGTCRESSFLVQHGSILDFGVIYQAGGGFKRIDTAVSQIVWLDRKHAYYCQPNMSLTLIQRQVISDRSSYFDSQGYTTKPQEDTLYYRFIRSSLALGYLFDLPFKSSTDEENNSTIVSLGVFGKVFTNPTDLMPYDLAYYARWKHWIYAGNFDPMFDFDTSIDLVFHRGRIGLQINTLFNIIDYIGFKRGNSITYLLLWGGKN